MPASCGSRVNTCSCLNLILACIVYWQASEISRVLSQCDPVANGIDFNTLFPKSSRLRAIPPICFPFRSKGFDHELIKRRKHGD